MKSFTRIIDYKCHNSYILKSDVEEYNMYYGTKNNFHEGALKVYIDRCLPLATKILSEYDFIKAVRSVKNADLIIIPGYIPKNDVSSFWRDWWKVGEDSVYGMPYGQSPKVGEVTCEFLGPHYSFLIQSVPREYFEFIHERLPTYTEEKLCSITMLLEHIVPTQDVDIDTIHTYLQSLDPAIRQMGALLLSSLNFKQHRLNCIQTLIKFKPILDTIDNKECKTRLSYTYGPYYTFDSTTPFKFFNELTSEQKELAYSNVFHTLQQSSLMDATLQFFFSYNNLTLRVRITVSDSESSVREFNLGTASMAECLYRYYFHSNRCFSKDIRTDLQTYLAYKNLSEADKERCRQNVFSKLNSSIKILFCYNREFYKNITFKIISNS